ncbi:MAG: hypothetical protein ACYTGX_15905 [Planctomycetota bacterium]|jgi:hypothetical protein
MIGEGDNRALLLVGEEALRREEWKEYGQYCVDRERGLRDAAFAKLESFLATASSWEFEQRREFVAWLCSKMDAIDRADYGPFPTPLVERLFKPTLELWIAQEPKNGDLLCLAARYTQDNDRYLEAIKVDPWNQRARLQLAEWAIFDVEDATHHLPGYFIGDPEEVLRREADAREHLAYIKDDDRRATLEAELEPAVQAAQDWIEFASEGGDDFLEWCRARGRAFRWDPDSRRRKYGE